jgi:hypothetical protein
MKTQLALFAALALAIGSRAGTDERPKTCLR